MCVASHRVCCQSVTGADWLTVCASRLADLLAVELGTNNDELLYQSARKLVIIEMQNIVYTEFLPTLLGMTHLQQTKKNPHPTEAGINLTFNQSNFCSKLLNYKQDVQRHVVG